MATVTVEKNTYKVDSLYQWDLNQTLEIYGLSLASIPEVHFCHKDMGAAIVRQATMDAAGVIRAEIPNSLLQKPYTVKVYVCVYEGSTFKTLYKIEVPVVARNKPADYTLEDDPEVYSFNALENKVEHALVACAAAETAYNAATNLAKSAKADLTEAKETYEKAVDTINEAVQTAVDDAVEELQDSIYTKEQTDEAIEKASSKVGDILTTVRTDLGDDWLLCNGEAVDSTEYPELANVLPGTPAADWTVETDAQLTQVFKESGYIIGLSKENGKFYYKVNYSDSWTAVTTGVGYVITNVRKLGNYWAVMVGRNLQAGRIWYNASLSSGTWTMAGYAGDVPTLDAAYNGKYYVLVGVFSSNSTVMLMYSTSINGTYNTKDISAAYTYSANDRFGYDEETHNLFFAVKSSSNANQSYVYKITQDLEKESESISTTSTSNPVGYCTNFVKIGNKLYCVQDTTINSETVGKLIEISPGDSTINFSLAMYDIAGFPNVSLAQSCVSEVVGNDIVFIGTNRSVVTVNVLSVSATQQGGAEYISPQIAKTQDGMWLAGSASNSNAYGYYSTGIGLPAITASGAYAYIKGR